MLKIHIYVLKQISMEKYSIEKIRPDECRDIIIINGGILILVSFSQYYMNFSHSLNGNGAGEINKMTR